MADFRHGVGKGGFMRVQFVWVFVAVLALPGQAIAKEKYQRVVPPPNVVPGLTKVAIIEAGDARSRSLQTAIARALRTELGKSDLPIADAGLRSDVLDFATATGPAVPGREEVQRIAQATGAQAVLVASGGGGQTAYETYNEDRTRSVKNESTGEYYKQEYTVKCAKRIVDTWWSATLYNAEDGGQVVKRGDQKTLSDKDCDEEGEDPLSLISEGDMIASALAKGSYAISLEFTPRWEVLELKFDKDRAAKDAVRLADGGDWVSAVDTAVDILRDDPYSGPAVFLLGLAAEVHGRSEDAIALHSLAKRMRSDRLYTQALSRSRERVAELQILQDTWGIAPEPVAFRNIDEVVQRAQQAMDVPVAGSPSEVKGTKNKRLPVLSAESSGDVVAMVPGGTFVRKLSSSGGMTEVQLPDGGQGWMDTKSLK
jgi:hypothetical protein